MTCSNQMQLNKGMIYHYKSCQISYQSWLVLIIKFNGKLDRIISSVQFINNTNKIFGLSSFLVLLTFILKLYKMQSELVLALIGLISLTSAVPLSENSPFIIDGEVVGPTEVPFAVGIMLHRPQNPGFCGGSLISRNYVLTAASCLTGFVLSFILTIYSLTYKKLFP